VRDAVKPHFLAPLLGPGQPQCRIVTTDGRVVARRVEPAFDAATRKRGLLGRTSLDPDTALVIAPCNAVHTCFMHFPIDIVFVARDGRVTKTAGGVRPWRLSASGRAFATIELAAGVIQHHGVRPGDVVIVEPANQRIEGAARPPSRVEPREQ
jgi:hypothetical protein